MVGLQYTPTRIDMRQPRRQPQLSSRPSHQLARVLSKLGLATRTEASRLISAGAVSVNGRTVLNPLHIVDPARDKITLCGNATEDTVKHYVILNKPRGLVTTRSDEQGRNTVYDALPAQWHHLQPVGRLDKASEGLLLFTNDHEWAAHLLAPDSHVPKIYHVQINRPLTTQELRLLETGITLDDETLSAQQARELRRGGKYAWLEITLSEGRNRHIRRLLTALEVSVLRLMRVQVGSLQLGSLAKGSARELTDEEMKRVASLPTPEFF